MNNPTGDTIDADADLTASLHRVLATLINTRQDRNPMPPERLRERLELVQWLRRELAAVETLLVAEYDKVRRAAAPVAGAPNR